jgi:hypothetical protein
VLEWLSQFDNVRVWLTQEPYAIKGFAITASDGQYRGIANVSAERISCALLDPPAA